MDIVDATGGRTLNHYCALSEPGDLVGIGFALPTGTAPPTDVYVILWDRYTEWSYASNNVSPIEVY